MSNLIRYACFSVLLIVLNNELMHGQPYTFYFDTKEDLSKPRAEQNRNYTLLRRNLRNGFEDTLLSNGGTIIGVWPGADQQRLFIEYEGKVTMLDVDAPQGLRSVEFDIRYQVSGFLDAYKVNRVYLTVQDQTNDDFDTNEYTLVVDRVTFARIDSVRDYLVASRPGGEPIDFLSQDHRSIYRRVVDKSGIYFDVFSTSTNQKVGVKRCGSLGNFKYGPAFDWGRNGKAVVSYEDEGYPPFAGLKYVICDVDAGTTLHTVPFPWRSEASLSSDGGKLIIEEVPWQEGRGPLTSGRFSIFSTTTGSLEQQLNLPAGTRIYVFESFPNELFCFHNYARQIVSIDENSIISVAALLDTLTSLKHRAGSLGWLGDANFVKELDNGLENAKKHLARGDSVNCYKEIQTFQDKVNKEYEKTVDNEKKGKPRDKRFVTVEGWKFLYYNAQYIMDRLPGGKR